MTIKEISKDALKVVGHIWAAPLTIVGLFYATLFTILGWYSWDSREGIALVFNTKKMPNFLVKLWKGWAGHTVGHVVVLAPMPELQRNITLRHEQEHVSQMMRFGIFQPIFYLMIMGVIKLCCKNAHYYLDNPFEIDARRAAGQRIDMLNQK